MKPRTPARSHLILGVIIVLFAGLFASGFYDLGQLVRKVDGKERAHVERSCIDSLSFLEQGFAASVPARLFRPKISIDLAQLLGSEANLSKPATKTFAERCVDKDGRKKNAAWELLAVRFERGRVRAVHSVERNGVGDSVADCLAQVLDEAAPPSKPNGWFGYSFCARPVNQLENAFRKSIFGNTSDGSGEQEQLLVERVAGAATGLGLPVAQPSLFAFVRLHVLLTPTGQLVGGFVSKKRGVSESELLAVLEKIRQLNYPALGVREGYAGVWVTMILDFQAETLGITPTTKVSYIKKLPASLAL